MKNPTNQENECHLEFACIGCNRTTQALAWGKCGLVVFGACNTVVLYKAKLKISAGKIIHLLNGHKSRVNCVQWLRSEDENDLEMISGSSDKDIILWQGRNGKWQLKQVISGHANAVCALASFSFEVDGKKNSFIASAGSDFSLKLWNRHTTADFECSQTISFGNGFAYTVVMSNLPNNKGLLLACGCDDTFVRLYALQDNQLELTLVLKGHKDCIRCLAFTRTGNDLLLASGSQDGYIRLWKISSYMKKEEDNFLSLKEETFTAGNEKLTVVLESVLIGHEGWVLGLSWNSSNLPSPTLLSASMDRTVIVWEYDVENEVWIDTARMGDVGGNSLGYYGCAFAPDGCTIITHGYHGAFQMWSKESKEGESNKWNAVITISGHFGEVEDFDWDPDGEFVITASTDQSTRLYAPWRREKFQTTWHEIARPQIHGYDMKGIAMLGRYRYASGAQEKVVRVFAAPKSFYDSFSCISNIKMDEKVVDLPVGATVPVLGLSNKAVYTDDIETWNKPFIDIAPPKKSSPFVDESPAPFNPTLISEPPLEDVLIQNTLWPEIQKLYGHGFEIFCLDSTPDGTVLATASKASKAEHADIFIWDTSSWKLIEKLSGHSLTVTQLTFSKNGEYLLSVSRDRTWALHKNNEENHLKYTLVQKTDKTNCIHTRIIWSADWFCDDRYFVTVSRDKKAIVWGRSDDGQCWSAVKDPLNAGESITAVTVSDRKTPSERYVVAIGLESGKINLYTWFNDSSASAWNLLLNVDKSLCPVLSIKRIRWRCSKNNTADSWYLGVCSSDHSFRILNFNTTLFV